ncbi:MAG: hypothetical protein HQK54_02485 [Oligoflexales bacterium]|nr:hypothetical protein [Oligoflexales bacterium]
MKDIDAQSSGDHFISSVGGRTASLVFIIILILLSLVQFPRNSRSEVSFQGSAKAGGSFYEPEEGSSSSFLDTCARGRVFYKNDDKFSSEAVYEVYPAYRIKGDQTVGDEVARDYRISDLNQKIHPPSSDSDSRFRAYQNLDRLNMSYGFESMDLSIGRQAVSFGTAKTMSPNDVILPFSMNAIDKEYRDGVDSIRMRIPLSTLSGIDLGVIFGKDFKKENGAGFVRSKFNINKIDLTLSFVNFKDNAQGGMEIGTQMEGASLWIDAAHTRPKGDDEFARFTFGGDYSFKNDLYLALEYHYNGIGKVSRKDYLLNALSRKAYRDKYVFLLARDYASIIFSYPVHPLFSFSGTFMSNLDDSSSLLSVKGEYNFRENWYLNIGSVSGFKGGSSGSEFGEYGKVHYGEVKYYF